MPWYSFVTRPVSGFFRRGGSKAIGKEGGAIVKAGGRFNGLKGRVSGLTGKAGDTINVITNTAKTSWKKVAGIFGAGGIAGGLGAIWAGDGGLRDFLSNLLGTTEDQTTVIMVVAGLIVVIVIVKGVMNWFSARRAVV